MTTHSSIGQMPTLPRAKKPLVPSAVLGALMFVVVEVMFFSGVMSALTISRAGAPEGTWPPPGQPDLASSSSGDVGIAVLFVSGALLVVAGRLVGRSVPKARQALLGCLVLGGVFVTLQVRHASQLVASGLTMTSSQLASFSFLLGGLHTIHAAATLVAIFVAWRRLGRGALSSGLLSASQVFWLFVVLIWPVLYVRLYV